MFRVVLEVSLFGMFQEGLFTAIFFYSYSDSARPKCSPDILSGQHFPCSDNLKNFRTNDGSIILFKVYF